MSEEVGSRGGQIGEDGSLVRVQIGKVFFMSCRNLFFQFFCLVLVIGLDGGVWVLGVSLIKYVLNYVIERF